MTYSYYSKLLRCWLDDPVENACDRLHIEYEFTHACQQDGHAPYHGDYQRDFVENIIGNIPLEPIIECLSKNNINGFVPEFSFCAVNVEKTDRFEHFMPVYIMHIRYCFSRENDYLKFLAKSILNNIPWETTKKAVFTLKD